MGARIRAIGVHIPGRGIPNDELSGTVDTSDEWIRTHTGIQFRHLAGEGEACSDMAVEAGKKVLEKAGVSAGVLDMIIVATVTPDYVHFPSTANIVQEKLGATRAGAFDLVTGCTGFVYALEVGRSLIAGGGASRVLVVGAEKLSSVVDWEDRNTCVLFGDGAGAAYMEQSDSTRGQILDSLLCSDGSGAGELIIKGGGSRNPFARGDVLDESIFLRMNGRAVYDFAVNAGKETIDSLLSRNHLLWKDVSWIVPHQANIRIIQSVAKRSGIPLERFYTNLDQYANTSAASIPIALEEMEEKGHLQEGELLLTVAFGAGLSYGGNLIRW